MTQSKEPTNQPTPQDRESQESPKSSLNRRDFIVAGAAAASALAFPGAAQARGRGTGGGRGKGLGKQAKQKAAEIIKWNNPFSEPQAYSTETLTTSTFPDLSVEEAEVTIKIPNASDPDNPNTITQTVRTYNGSVPGPTYKLMPGEKLELDLINNLGPNTPAPAPYNNMDCEALSNNNVPGCFNTTNLHTHGLHVSPCTKPGSNGTKYDEDSVSSDDVHVRIPPATDPNGMDIGDWLSTRHYCFQLPEFHAPGTHWYHAHIHGATAIQVVNGLAGALIVEEPDDQKIEVDDEKILIIQEIIGSTETTDDTNIYGNIRSPIDNTKTYGNNPGGNIQFTINSLNTPTINITTDEIQRWRVINATATPRGFMDLGIYDGTCNDGGNFVSNVMHLIAVDGITFYGQDPNDPSDYPDTVVNSPGQLMAPANRADFLVQFSQPGTYQLWKKKTFVRNGSTGPSTDQLLAFIHVTGAPVEELKPLPSLPGIDKRPCYLEPITDDEIIKTQSFTYTVPQPGKFGAFTINDEPYGQPDGVPPNTDVQLGTAEEWKLINTSKAAHPFHIHVNPFQVLEVFDPGGVRTIGPIEPKDATWWDSFLIPPATFDGSGNLKCCGYVRIRSRFLHYPGKFVQHCHILIHEDSGMMWDVTVNRDGTEPCYETVNGDGTGPCEELADCSLATPLPAPAPAPAPSK